MSNPVDFRLGRTLCVFAAAAVTIAAIIWLRQPAQTRPSPALIPVSSKAANDSKSFFIPAPRTGTRAPRPVVNPSSDTAYLSMDVNGGLEETSLSTLGIPEKDRPAVREIYGNWRAKQAKAAASRMLLASDAKDTGHIVFELYALEDRGRSIRDELGTELATVTGGRIANQIISLLGKSSFEQYGRYDVRFEFDHSSDEIVLKMFDAETGSEGTHGKLSRREYERYFGPMPDFPRAPR